MWRVEVNKDTEDANIGTVTATWTVVDVITKETTETFTYSERVERTGGKVDGFVTRAKAALTSYQLTKSNLETIKTTITDKLNT